MSFRVVLDDSKKVEYTLSPEGSVSSPQAVPGTYKTVTQYIRESGKPKVVLAVTTDSASVYLDEPKLFSQFDIIAALDTNTLKINGVRLSATCLRISNSDLNSEEIKFSQHGFAMTGVPEQFNPEMVALDIVLRSYLRPTQDPLKIGIFMDCALGDHDKINERLMPYLDNKILRKGVTLLYASAESGKGLGRELMQSCNSQADKIKDFCLANPEKMLSMAGKYPYCKNLTEFEYRAA